MLSKVSGEGQLLLVSLDIYMCKVTWYSEIYIENTCLFTV